MERFAQNYKEKTVYLIETVKTVDWLINNTEVQVFRPKDFSGYQRKINENHCNDLVKYLEKDFYLPTSIICACDNEYSKDRKLRIVDGQHRIHALRKLKENNIKRYLEIKDYNLPILVLENPDIDVEIETFISINKKTKKVDTSLAYVLRNKVSRGKSEELLSMSKREYLSVELANVLNNNENNAMWFNKISFEGNSKNGPECISLNAFVISTRRLIACLEKIGFLSLDWNETTIKDNINKMHNITNIIWNCIYKKWPNLFLDDKNAIIQGSIGYSSINKYITFRINKDDLNKDSLDILYEKVEKYIFDINVKETYWLPGGKYSKYSSESGYSIVAQDLNESTIQKFI